MPRYVRFVCPQSESGVFQAAYGLLSKDELPREDRAELQMLVRWFGANLKTPDRLVKTTSKGFYRREPAALSWFKDDAGDCIQRMWSIVRLLERNGIPIELTRTSQPGYITYEDEHQIAAIPFTDR